MTNEQTDSMALKEREEHKPNNMIWKTLRVLPIVVVILAGDSGLMASSQQQAPQGREITLVAAATVGATLGAFSVGLFEYSSALLKHCNGELSPRDFVLQYIKHYTWEKYLSMMLGPAVGAVAGIIAVSQIYGLEGNTAMALVSGFVGTGAGLGTGCYLVRVTKGQPAVLEFVAAVLLPIGWAALGAVNFYNARSRSSPRASHQEASSLPTVSVTLWSLRF